MHSLCLQMFTRTTVDPQHQFWIQFDLYADTLLSQYSYVFTISYFSFTCTYQKSFIWNIGVHFIQSSVSITFDTYQHLHSIHFSLSCPFCFDTPRPLRSGLKLFSFLKKLSQLSLLHNFMLDTIYFSFLQSSHNTKISFSFYTLNSLVSFKSPDM